MIEERLKTDCVIIVDLKSMAKKRNKSVYELSKETGIRYHIVKKYYKNEVYRVDLDILEKFCTALNCEPNDIIKRKNKNL
ncbi:MAG: helix-turn-helix transcriptional regulator [Bacilli bacterium]|nr:helix-turn-helix transcriptional regulator [Bacilli bacterium]